MYRCRGGQVGRLESLNFETSRSAFLLRSSLVTEAAGVMPRIVARLLWPVCPGPRPCMKSYLKMKLACLFKSIRRFCPDCIIRFHNIVSRVSHVFAVRSKLYTSTQYFQSSTGSFMLKRKPYEALKIGYATRYIDRGRYGIHQSNQHPTQLLRCSTLLMVHLLHQEYLLLQYSRKCIPISRKDGLVHLPQSSPLHVLDYLR